MNVLLLFCLFSAFMAPVFSARDAEASMLMNFSLFTSAVFLASFSFFYAIHPTPTCLVDYTHFDDNIDGADWLPTKTDPSAHAPVPSATQMISTFDISSEEIASFAQISQTSITVQLSLALLCFAFCAGCIRRFKHVWAANKLSMDSSANVVKTADAQTATIETANFVPGAIKTANTGTDVVETANTGTDAVETANTGTNAVKTTNTGTDAVETTNTGTDAVETANFGTDAVETANTGINAIKTTNTGTDAVETANTGTDAVETANFGTDAVKTINSGTDAIKTTNTGTDAVETANTGINAIKTTNTGTDAVETANTGTDAVETANFGTDAVKTINSGTDAIKTTNTGTDAVETAISGTDAIATASPDTNVIEAATKHTTKTPILAITTADSMSAYVVARRSLIAAGKRAEHGHSKNFAPPTTQQLHNAQSIKPAAEATVNTAQIKYAPATIHVAAAQSSEPAVVNVDSEYADDSTNDDSADNDELSDNDWIQVSQFDAPFLALQHKRLFRGKKRAQLRLVGKAMQLAVKSKHVRNANF